MGNVIGCFASRFGFVGAIVVGIVLIYLCYILYRHLRYLDKEWDALDLVAVVGLLQFMVLPVCMEMITFYCVCIFCCAVRTTGWKLHFFRKEKEEYMGRNESLPDIMGDTFNRISMIMRFPSSTIWNILKIIQKTRTVAPLKMNV